ncbi:MAG: DNA polymerase III subunit alpha, partial [candidate division WOR-3 bacterium]
ILGRENFYIELMRLGSRAQESLNRELVKLAQEFDLPVVATNDCHYLTRDDVLAHDILLCIQTKKLLTDKERMRFETKQAYFRSAEEMAKIFQDLPEAVTNTQLIAERCNLMLNLGGKNLHLPRYPKPEGFNSDFDYIKFLAQEGLKKRYGRPTPGIEERLAYELEIIRNSGLAGYFLVVKEIIDFARERNIPVGPGRGSAVGSLVLYCLSITDIDPIKYELIFERFLNPERLSMPDIDTDFGDTRRDEVIEFIKKRYGEKNVTQIITFGTMQAKAVIRDVGRVLSIPLKDVDYL